jgi:sugar lactone lactonase YvrE
MERQNVADPVGLPSALSGVVSGRTARLLGLLLLLPACGIELRSRSNIRLDTLQSGIIVVHNAGAGMWHEGSAWMLTDAVTIGSQNDSGNAVFGKVVDIALDQGGRVYILDGMAAEIRVFASDGSYIRTIGRKGHGPGEFFVAPGMRFDPRDRLWVLNQGNQRYSVFDTSGALLREFPRHMAARFLVWRDGAFSPTGDLYDLLMYPTKRGWETGCARYDTLTAEFVDTLPCPVMPEGTPFGWGRIVATPLGWWVGAATDYRLWQLTRAGDTVRVVEREHEPVGLSTAQRDSIRDAMHLLQQRARGAASLPIPERQRIFDGIVVDNHGYVWDQLSRTPDERATSFDVFDPEGRYLGAVKAPAVVESKPTPAVRDDRMAYVTTNELGAEFVVTVRIRGRR